MGASEEGKASDQGKGQGKGSCWLGRGRQTKRGKEGASEGGISSQRGGFRVRTRVPAQQKAGEQGATSDKGV